MKHDLASAFAFAQQAHSSHLGYDGQPYFPHIAWVVDEVQRLIAGLPVGTMSERDTMICLIVACLHDCVEDEKHTGVTYDTLVAEGFDDEVVTCVRRLDGRFKKGSYQHDIEAMVIEGDLRVILVKLGDNRHNRSPERAATRPAHMDGIQRRYDRAGEVLEAAYRENGGTTLPRA